MAGGAPATHGLPPVAHALCRRVPPGRLAFPAAGGACRLTVIPNSVRGKSMTSSNATTARLTACARGFGLAAALMAAAAGGAAAQDTKTMVIKLAHRDPQRRPARMAEALCGRQIDKNTNGRIKAEIYPASQLGAIPRMIEGTQLGSIQIWVGPPEFLVGVDQRFELLSVPGLFKDDQHAVKIINDAEVRQGVPLGRRQQGPGRRQPVLTGPARLRHAGADAHPRRPQGQEGPRAGLAVPDGAAHAAGRDRRAAHRSATSCRRCSRAPSTARSARCRCSRRCSTTARPNT